MNLLVIFALLAQTPHSGVSISFFFLHFAKGKTSSGTSFIRCCLKQHTWKVELQRSVDPSNELAATSMFEWSFYEQKVPNICFLKNFSDVRTWGLSWISLARWGKTSEFIIFGAVGNYSDHKQTVHWLIKQIMCRCIHHESNSKVQLYLQDSTSREQCSSSSRSFLIKHLVRCTTLTKSTTC